MKKLSLLLVAILCLTAFAGLSALAENNDDMVVVATQFGQIRGDQVSDELIIYKGVPYAAPPVGELRWKAPIDPEPWEGVLDCTEFNPMGMQVMDMECWWAEDLWYPWLDEYPNMSEDSLYLQIYSPAKSAADNLPVFVWIHGGASQHGVTYDAQAAAEELAARGIIVVEVEYRMGLFGFYTSDELDAESETGTSGNYGLMDNIKALEWIQDNITAFGGDPTRVVIGGQSAGCSMVTYLMSSPLLTDDLWSGAVMCSTFRPFGTLKTQEQAKETGKKYLDFMGVGDYTLEELRELPATFFCNEETDVNDYEVGWGSCLDGYVLTMDPVDFYTQPNAINGKNLLFGSCSGEGNASFTIQETEAIFEAAKETYGELYDKYDFEYIYRTTDDIAATMEDLRLDSQLNAIAGMLNGAYLKALNPDSDFYCFFFSHWTPGREAELRWAWHSADLWYWFDSMRDVPEQRDWTELDYQIGDWCSTYWANFTATGDPNGDTVPVWNATTVEAPCFNDLGDEFVMRDSFYEGSHQLEGRDGLMLDHTIISNGYDGMFDDMIGK